MNSILLAATVRSVAHSVHTLLLRKSTRFLDKKTLDSLKKHYITITITLSRSESEQWVWCANIETGSYSKADHTRRIRKGRGVTKSDACAQKTHTTHGVWIQLYTQRLSPENGLHCQKTHCATHCKVETKKTEESSKQRLCLFEQVTATLQMTTVAL